MTTIPLMDCCALLGIDPKTLRQWLKRAQMQPLPHPLDARMKCLMEEQIQQLARLYDRPLLAHASPHDPLTPARAAAEQPQLEIGSLFVPPTTLRLAPGSQETELLQKLIALETRVTILQEQLNQLVLALFQERQQHRTSPVSSPDSALQPISEQGPAPVTF